MSNPRLSRDDLAAFLPNPRAIRAFERNFEQVERNSGDVVIAQGAADAAQSDAASALAALGSGTYVLLAPDVTIPNGRTIAAGNLVTLTDGGAGAPLTVAVDKLTIAGAFSLALTLGANSALTLPASGTLATLAGAENLSNKTLDQLRTANSAAVSVAVANRSVPVVIGGVTLYALLSTTP